MTTFFDKLSEADETYKNGVIYLEETMVRDLRRFLFNDKKRFMVAQAIVPYQVVGSIKKSFDTLEPKLKTKYDKDLRCLTWDQCANIVKTSKIISKLPGLMILDYDKLEVGADDLELLRKITERMDLIKNTKIIISISPNTKDLCDLLKVLEDNSYFDFNYSTTKVDLQPPDRAKRPSSLIEAATLGDYDEVNVFMESGENVDVQDGEGNTALHMAAKNGHSEIVQVLLGHGANYLGKKSGETPLHLAAQKGHVKVVDILLACNANVNEIDKWSQTPLYFASMYGHNNVVSMLVEYGANVNTQDKFGQSPLHVAVYNHRTEVVETLLHYGAKVDAVTKYGETALHLAASRGFMVIIKILINYGANCKLMYDGRTPAQWAAKNGFSEVANYINHPSEESERSVAPSEKCSQ